MLQARGKTVKNISEAIHGYIKDNRDNIVGQLKDLARIPSLAAEAKDSAMFGEGCAKAILHTEALFRKSGLKTHTQKDCAYTVGKTEGDGKTIGLFCHADVVAAVEEDWIITKPFEPVEKDGFLVGRGVEDNKAGIVSAIWAVNALKYANALPKSSVLIYAGSNEECGMSDLEIFNKDYPSPDFSIVPDNEYPVCRGEKGILRFWADFRTAFENIISIKGGQSLNIVLGSVDCEIRYSEKLFSQLKAACEEKEEYILTNDKKTIKLTAKGRSTHAAYSKNSLNAFFVMIQALKKCDALEGDINILLNAEKLVIDPFSEAVGLKTFDPEFLETTCTNGIVETPNGCLSLSFDTRYGTEVDIDSVTDGYKKYLDSVNADCRITERDDGYVIPESAPIITAMTDAWYSITGNKDNAKLSYGGTYARKLKNAVSIGTCIPTTPALSLPDGHGGAHQSDEAIDIEGLLKSIEVIAHMILKADETLHA